MTTPGVYEVDEYDGSLYDNTKKHNIDLHQPFNKNKAITHPIRAVQYAVVEILRKEIPRVQNRVYPPGIRNDAQFPRITVSSMSPREKRFIGEKWKIDEISRITIHPFKIDSWSKNPIECEEIADDIQAAIFRNRGFLPSNYQKGYIIDCHFIGGSETTLNPALQVFHRSINVEVWWLSYGTPY